MLSSKLGRRAFMKGMAAIAAAVSIPAGASSAQAPVIDVPDIDIDDELPLYATHAHDTNGLRLIIDGIVFPVESVNISVEQPNVELQFTAFDAGGDWWKLGVSGDAYDIEVRGPGVPNYRLGKSYVSAMNYSINYFDNEPRVDGVIQVGTLLMS